MVQRHTFVLLGTVLFYVVLVQGATCPAGTATNTNVPRTSLQPPCNVCLPGYGATICSATMCRAGTGVTRTTDKLMCTACTAGTYNLGGNTTACMPCASSPPPACRVCKSCATTSGACVWGLALNGTACSSSGVNGTCTTTGSCQATGLRLVYQNSTGSTGRIPGVLNITMPPGAFNSSTAPVTITLTAPSLYANALLSMATAMFDLGAHGQQVVTITAPSQPLGTIDVSLFQGAGNAFLSDGASALTSPALELRVMYVNRYIAPTAAGEQAFSSLEVLVERAVASASGYITASLPAWVFQPVGGVYRADILLAATSTYMGARRRALLAAPQHPDSADSASDAAPLAAHAAGPSAAQAAAAAPRPQCRVTTNAYSRSCPPGWPPKAAAARTSPRTAAVSGALLHASAAAASTTAASTGVCAGAPLARPLPPDNTVVESFGPKFFPPATWAFHPGIDFGVAVGSSVLATHAGVVVLGSSTELGSYVLLRGGEGTVLYAPATAAPGVAGKTVARGDVVATTTKTFLHIGYAPKGDVFAVATTIDPVPCFVAGTGSTGQELPTCDPTKQPPLPPNQANINTTISPGTSRDFDMFLCTRQVSITRDLDVALIVDVTASFGDDLPVIKNLAPGLWQALAAKAPGLRMALTTFQDFSDGAGVYQLMQDFTASNATWVAAVNAMSLGDGGDFAEAQLVAIRRSLTELSWRDTATRVMVLTTDSSFHTEGTCCSSGYGTIQEAGAALAAKGVKFVGLCQSTEGYLGCDASQMQALVDAAGGAVMTAAASNSADIADKIYAGLSMLLYNIVPTAVSPCENMVSFTPASVPSVGTSKVLAFKERVALPAGASGTLQCQVQVMADKGVMATQNLTINSGVPGKPYTECRQVARTVTSLAMRQRPCNTAPFVGVSIPSCERFQYLAAARPKVSECVGSGDFSCWIEVIYNGKRGWISSGSGTRCGGGSDPSDTAYVAYCPATGCPAKSPTSRCRQVIASEGVGLRPWPCHMDTTPTGANNAILQYLSRGETVTYMDENSKQTSCCGSPPAFGTLPLCWVYVSTDSGVKGFIPAVRGFFDDAFCHTSSDNATQALQSLIVTPCAKEAYTECRQVVKPEGVVVYVLPADTSLPVTGDVATSTLARCGRFDYVVGTKVEAAGHCWIMVRFKQPIYDTKGQLITSRLQYGWLMSGECAGTSPTSYVALCPASACPQDAVCRQVTAPAGVTLRKDPCWSSTAIVDLPMWSTFQYQGSYSKQTSLCGGGYDGLCWVKASFGSNAGWLPAGRAPVNSTFADTACNTLSGEVGTALVREFCDFCIGKTCPPPTAHCLSQGHCVPQTGSCVYDVTNGAACITSAGKQGKCTADAKCLAVEVSSGFTPVGPSAIVPVGASNCPDLECMPLLDMSLWNAEVPGLGDAAIMVDAVGEALSTVLPTSALMLIAHEVLGPTPPCVLSVHTGDELLAAGKQQFESLSGGLANSLLAYLATISPDEAKGVAGAVKASIGVCKDLPLLAGNNLAKQHYLSAILSTGGLIGYLKSRLPFLNEQNPTSNLLKNLVSDFTLCAAINPCKDDYLMAASGLGVTITFTIEAVPVKVKASLTQVGYSGRGWLQQQVTAWDAFNTHSTGPGPFGAWTWTVDGKLQIGGALQIGAGMKLSEVNAALAESLGAFGQSAALELSVTANGKMMVNTHGVASAGFHVGETVVVGTMGYPMLSIFGIIELPAGGLLTSNEQEGTLALARTPGGVSVFVSFHIRDNLKTLLSRVKPFGSWLASLVDDDSNDFGIEVRVEVDDAGIRTGLRLRVLEHVSGLDKLLHWIDSSIPIGPTDLDLAIIVTRMPNAPIQLTLAARNPGRNTVQYTFVCKDIAALFFPIFCN